MRRWVTVLIVAGTVCAPTAADATSTRRPAKAESAAALSQVLIERGLGCDGFVDADDSQASTFPGGPPIGDTGECTVGGVTASISVYDSRRELGRALVAMPVLCRLAMAVVGPVELTFVTGRNWSISFFRDQYDPAVGKALGAKVRDVDCAKVARG